MSDFKPGDPVHFWGRKYGVSLCCYRAVVLSVGPIMRVRLMDSQEPVPVRTVPANRLKPGWNNWVDQEGRPILPEHFAKKEG